jgi:hypothetical protein
VRATEMLVGGRILLHSSGSSRLALLFLRPTPFREQLGQKPHFLRSWNRSTQMPLVRYYSTLFQDQLPRLQQTSPQLRRRLRPRHNPRQRPPSPRRLMLRLNPHQRLRPRHSQRQWPLRPRPRRVLRRRRFGTPGLLSNVRIALRVVSPNIGLSEHAGAAAGIFCAPKIRIEAAYNRRALRNH